MNGDLLFWLGLFSAAIACFAAMAVHSFHEFSRAQLREMLRQRNQLPRFDDIIEQHLQVSLAAESLRVLATAAAVFAAAIDLKVSTGEQSHWAAAFGLAAGGIALGALALWLLIVWLPVAVSRAWAEPFIAGTWPFWRLCGQLFAPSIAVAEFLARALRRISGKKEHVHTEESLEQEIREVVTEGQREGLIEEDAREMIESVMALGEVVVKEIMTPRTDMISMPADISWDDALKFVIASGHTRIPVYGGSRDEIVGILHIKDMLHEMAGGGKSPSRPIAQLLWPPFFVPESKPVDGLLQEFQLSRNHIAVVLDEFGGVSGLVTIEDVLEEIVGEISDEHDDAASDGIKTTGENRCEVLARVHISELNERFGLHLPEVEHFDTIGGLVFHQLGRIPHIGEELIADGVRIKVLDTTRRRINRVSLEVLPPETAAEPSSEVGSDASDR
ncbi:MAG TPA: hemolysin family protein [Pirellulales bacterium]|jgi:CBS domain containing-hemolysin-like protein